MREIPQVLHRPKMAHDNKDDNAMPSSVVITLSLITSIIHSVCDFAIGIMYEANVNYEANGSNLAMFPPSPTGSLQSILPSTPSGDNRNVSSESSGNFRSP